MCQRFDVRPGIREAALRAEERVRSLAYPAQLEAKCNVLAAFLEEGLNESDFAGSLGYGYDDAARAHYESLIARIFGTQRALARLSLVSGTHGIVTAIAACVPPGRTLLSITGKPYDTLHHALVTAPHALCEGGMRFAQIPLDADGAVDAAQLERALADERIAAVFIQRSRGYAPRPSIGVGAIEAAASVVKRCRSDVIVLVDNCYGELVEPREPSRNVDALIGSLIKNLGASIAPSGAYVTGNADVVERIAVRHYAPGLRDALGSTLGFGRVLAQGLFLAPLVVEQALRGLDFAAALFEELGYGVDPRAGDVRTDVLQAIRLKDADELLRFAAGLQRALPVNARFRPEPGTVPGYADRVVMSSGAFVSGSTIELSCDAPMRPPFEMYLQGGVSYEHAVLGSLFAADAVAG